MLSANEEKERQERAARDQATMAAEAALAASSLKLIATQPSLPMDSAPATADAYALLAVNGTASDFEAVSSAAIVDELASAPAEPTAAAVAPAARAHVIAQAIARLSPAGLLKLRRLNKLRVLLTKVPAEAQGVLRSAAPAAPAVSKLSTQGKGTTRRLLRLQLVQLVKALVVSEETKLGNWAAEELGSWAPEVRPEARRTEKEEEEARRKEEKEARRKEKEEEEAALAAARWERWEAQRKEEAEEEEARRKEAAAHWARRALQLDRMRSSPPEAFDVATPEEKSQFTAFFNSGKFAEWPPEMLLLVRRTLPKVVEKLNGFVEAAELHERHGYNVATELSPLVTERLISIGAVLEPFYLASGAAARDGILPLSYSASEQVSPEACEQRCLTRLVQAFVLLYSPLYRRRAGGQHELFLIWRHIEPYIFAEPEALDPRGELLSGEWHGRQHIATRGTRRELGEPLGGYLEYCDQGHNASSINVMFDSMNFCVRAIEDELAHTKIMTDGGKLALALTEQFNLPTSAPIDLLSGALFIKCVDIRFSDPVSVSWLLRVLQMPVLRRRISVGEPGKGPGTSEQQRVKTQVDVDKLAGFHRLQGSAYKLSNLDVAEGRPAVGTPVPCLDTVAYGRVHNDAGHFRL